MESKIVHELLDWESKDSNFLLKRPFFETKMFMVATFRH